MAKKPPTRTLSLPIPIGKTKRRLSNSEEFEVMKLVLDKFLWISTGLFGFGIYRSIAVDVQDGLWYVLAGALLMVLFAWFILSEFERIR